MSKTSTTKKTIRRAGVRVSSTRPSTGSTAARTRVPRKTKSDAVVTRLVDDARDREWRDAFAMAALQGGFDQYLTTGAWDGYEDFAESCFNVADALMRERAKRS